MARSAYRMARAASDAVGRTFLHSLHVYRSSQHIPFRRARSQRARLRGDVADGRHAAVIDRTPGRRPDRTSASRFSSAASATPTSTRCATSGRARMPTQYPCVPGHEIVGRVTAVGSKVTRFREGDLAGVGCLVGSCGTCTELPRRARELLRADADVHLQQPRRRHRRRHLRRLLRAASSSTRSSRCASPTRSISPAAAPLLCAGITTYSPLRHWNVGKGQKVGIVGLGGLGHMGVKFAHAFGARVVLFTTSEGKRDGRPAARRRRGRRVARTPSEMAKHANSFDFILDTVSAAARRQRLHLAARPQWHAHDGGRAGAAAADVGDQPALQAALVCRLDHRRPARNAGDARLLRRARDHRRHRADRHPADRRGVRAAARRAT